EMIADKDDASQEETATEDAGDGETDQGLLVDAEEETEPSADEMIADKDDASQEETATEGAGDGETDQGLLVDAEEETEPSAGQITEPEIGDEETEKMA
ncbi:MAG: hypothetical protein JRI47_09195, partial [Deltaproteobacteria bacterium]|nr:hypothetical protein [Deltaproteobacteria bacterium]